MWHPRAAPPLNELLDAIQRRGLAWTATDRTLSVIVRTLAAPLAATHGSSPVPTVLVLIDPLHLTHIDEVLDVVSRYRPRTALWVFDPADPGRLKSMQALEIIAKYVSHKNEEAPRSTEHTLDPSASATPRRLQLAGLDGPDHPPPKSSPPATPFPAASIQSPTNLSADEFSMLIEAPSKQSGVRSVY